MATSKLWAVHGSPGATLNYVLNDSKTYPQSTWLDCIHNNPGLEDLQIDLAADKRLVLGFNLADPLKAEDDFLLNKAEWAVKKAGNRKMSGVTAYHAYVSFGPKDKLSAVDVLAAAREIATRMWGTDFQGIIAVHTNTENLHAHIVIDSVSITDGHKAWGNEKNYFHLRHEVDGVCKDYGLQITQPGSRKAMPAGEVGYALALVLTEYGDSVDAELRLKEQFGIKVTGEDRIQTPDHLTHYLSQFDASWHIHPHELSLTPSRYVVEEPEEVKVELDNMSKPEETKVDMRAVLTALDTPKPEKKKEKKIEPELSETELYPSLLEPEEPIEDLSNDDDNIFGL